MSKNLDSNIINTDSLIIQLYDDYAVEMGDTIKYFWPKETERWNELVFCILTAIGESEVAPTVIRSFVNTFRGFELLELQKLAELNPLNDNLSDPLTITLKTLLLEIGFSPKTSVSAINAISEAAVSIKENYDGKVQNYYHHYGMKIVENIKEDFKFSDFDNAPKAIAFWLQNTLNMPVPMTDPIVEKACESIGVRYEELVEAANEHDLNVALLDDALRVYWNKLSR